MIAIIPARAGSKSIPNKNLQRVGKKHLVAHAVDLAKKAGIFDKIILTTDILDLHEEYQDDKKITLIHRKETHATDNALMKDVVLHVLQEFSDHSYFWLLQPTSPFRSLANVRDIEALLKTKEPQSVISVKEAGPNHPNRTYTIKCERLMPLRYTNFDNKQDLKNVYIRNGCFYVCNIKTFIRQKNFYIHPCLAYVMDELQSINIDGPLDLTLARSVSFRE